MPMDSKEKLKLSKKLDQLRGLLDDIMECANRSSEVDSQNFALARRGSNIEAARKIYHQRRARARHFSEQSLFGEPAWDMLLDIFIRQELGEVVSIKSACIGSMVPHTTALRWLNVLAAEGLVGLEDDPTDHRRRNVILTPRGAEAMANFLHEIEG